MNDLEALRTRLRAFAAARDWDQFHSPKNLVMALTSEVGELVERFQWLDEGQSQHLTASDLRKVADEVADVQLYLLRLADKLGLDLLAECARKLEENEKKYPVEKARGNSRKYTEY